MLGAALAFGILIGACSIDTPVDEDADVDVDTSALAVQLAADINAMQRGRPSRGAEPSAALRLRY
jgi:hypothetical protein